MRLWFSLAFICLAASFARAQSYSGGLPLTVTATNPSVGTNAATGPTSSTQVGFQDGSGNLQPLTGSSGLLKVDAGGTSITGTVKIADGNGGGVASVKTLGTQVVSTDQGIVANTVIHGLNSGGGGSYVDVKVNPSGALTVDATQSGTWSTRLQDGSGSAVNKGQTTMSGSLPVVIASDQSVISITSTGKNAGSFARNDYSSVNVGTGAYVQLTASIGPCTEAEIFDSSGQTLYLATGAAASEVNQVEIYPGGNGRIPLKINAGTRLSLKAVSGTASAGEIDLNCYN